jgi:hypothetical protein
LNEPAITLREARAFAGRRLDTHAVEGERRVFGAGVATASPEDPLRPAAAALPAAPFPASGDVPASGADWPTFEANKSLDMIDPAQSPKTSDAPSAPAG